MDDNEFNKLVEKSSKDNKQLNYYLISIIIIVIIIGIIFFYLRKNNSNSPEKYKGFGSTINIYCSNSLCYNDTEYHLNDWLGSYTCEKNKCNILAISFYFPRIIVKDENNYYEYNYKNNIRKKINLNTGSFAYYIEDQSNIYALSVNNEYLFDINTNKLLTEKKYNQTVLVNNKYMYAQDENNTYIISLNDLNIKKIYNQKYDVMEIKLDTEYYLIINGGIYKNIVDLIDDNMNSIIDKYPSSFREIYYGNELTITINNKDYIVDGFGNIK